VRPIGDSGSADPHVLDGAEGHHSPASGLPSRVSFKPKRCRTCRRGFTPDRFGKVCCSPSCAITHSRLSGSEKQSAATKRVRAAEKAERRQQLEKIVSLSKLKNRAQTAFNRYIRERDAGEPCISCGRNTGAKMNAGHYRTTAAAPHLRYDERACFLQCEHCNSWLSGNQIEYRKALIVRFGVEYVAELDRDSGDKKWSREELIAIRKLYIDKWKLLKVRQVRGLLEMAT
jgi:hypothetical protein